VLIASLVVSDALALMLDPDPIAVPTQLDALMDQLLRRAVETAGEFQVAVGRDPRAAAARGVEADRRECPERLALNGQSLSERPSENVAWGEKLAAGGEKWWPWVGRNRGRGQPLGLLSGGADGPVGVELEQVVGCGD
jgi:hypothetical protein